MNPRNILFNKPQILLTGSLAIDQIMTFPGQFKDVIQPEKLDVLSISVLANSLRRSEGGVAGNIAYSLGLLGENPILYAAINKADENYITQLKKLGVDVDFVYYSPLPTAMFSVLTDSNNCQVAGFYPGAMGDANNLTINRFAEENVFVVISPHDPSQMVRQIEECKILKKRMCFDIGQQILALSQAELKKGIAAAELLILNDYEFGMLIKKSNLSKTDILRPLEVCVITLGEKGVEVYEKTKGYKPIKISAVKVNNVVDPTGAGDAFRAGFLYGYIRAWENQISAELGSCIASYAIENHGTQAHKFTWDLLEKRYLKSYNKVLKH
jgi:adenosine kinase